MGKYGNLKILMIILDGVLSMVGHSFTTVERETHLLLFVIYFVTTILFMNKNDVKFYRNCYCVSVCFFVLFYCW